jgi:hypothetical protein
VILAHENVRKRMLASPQTILKEYPAYLEDAKKKGNARTSSSSRTSIAWAKKVKVEEIAAPVVTFDSEVAIHVGDETISRLAHAARAHRRRQRHPTSRRRRCSTWATSSSTG